MTQNVESSAGVVEQADATGASQASGQASVCRSSTGQPSPQEPLTGSAAAPGGQLDEDLVELIKSEVERRFQSAKDRRWAQLERQYGDLNALAEQAKRAPDSGESGERPEAEMDDLARQLAAYPALVQALAGLALGSERLPQQAASAATAVIPGGGDAPADLLQAYERRKRRIKPGDVNALTALKQEFRAKGLKIY